MAAAMSFAGAGSRASAAAAAHSSTPAAMDRRVGRPGFLSRLGFRLPLLGDAPGLGQGPPGLLQ